MSVEIVETGEHDAEAFNRHRAKHQPRRIKIGGHTLSTWARGLHANELRIMEMAIRSGIDAGMSNTDVAHNVIGSRRYNGSNGVTEITRQHILRLAKGYLQKRKSRMGGSSEDDPMSAKRKSPNEA